MWSDSLSTTEAQSTRAALEELRRASWASALVSNVERNGGLTSANRSLLFEVRFAYQLLLAGLKPVYEYKAGVGGSSIDFFVDHGPGWLIELVSLEETNALKAATRANGLVYQQRLSSDAEDSRHSGEGQMLKAIERIGEKVARS